jgi:hypothetical protein
MGTAMPRIGLTKALCGHVFSRLSTGAGYLAERGELSIRVPCEARSVAGNVSSRWLRTPITRTTAPKPRPAFSAPAVWTQASGILRARLRNTASSSARWTAG